MDLDPIFGFPSGGDSTLPKVTSDKKIPFSPSLDGLALMANVDLELTDCLDYRPIIDAERKNRGNMSYHEQRMLPTQIAHPELDDYVQEEAANLVATYVKQNRAIVLDQQDMLELMKFFAGAFYGGFFMGKEVQKEIEQKKSFDKQG